VRQQIKDEDALPVTPVAAMSPESYCTSASTGSATRSKITSAIQALAPHRNPVLNFLAATNLTLLDQAVSPDLIDFIH